MNEFLYHPNFRVCRHLLIILLIFPITLSQSFFVFGNSPAIPINMIYLSGTVLAIFTIVIIYLNIYYLAPHFLSKREYASYAIALFLLVAGLIFFKYVAEYTIFSNAGIYKRVNGVTVLDGLSNTVLYAVCVASSSIAILFKQLIADNEEIKGLENKQLENSIAEIKNRIQPEFLYATLDYASEKVKSEPNQTSDTLFKLSELLRYQLYDCTRNKVLLGSNIEFIRNYLFLAQQNSGNRFTFSLLVTGDSNKLVPPSVFTQWIEEIISQQPEKLIIHFDIRDCWVLFECKVSGIELIQNNFKKTEQKMHLLYGKNTVFEIGLNAVKLHFNAC